MKLYEAVHKSVRMSPCGLVWFGESMVARKFIISLQSSSELYSLSLFDLNVFYLRSLSDCEYKINQS